MRLDLSVPTPLAYFASLVQRDAELPLLEAAACLAQDASPELDVQQVLHEVDRLAERIHDTAEHLVADRNVHDAAGRAALVALLDGVDFAEQDRAHIVLSPTRSSTCDPAG